MPVVRISDDLFARLQKHATPLVDSTNDVLERILNAYESASRPSSAAAADDSFASFPDLWKFTIEEYNKINPRFSMRPPIPNQYWKQIKVGLPDVHYEFAVRKRDRRFDACIHFESTDLKTNLSRLELVTANATSLRHGIQEEFQAGVWGSKRKWAQLMFRVPFGGSLPDRRAVARGIELMDTLVERSWPSLSPLAEK